VKSSVFLFFSNCLDLLIRRLIIRGERTETAIFRDAYRKDEISG
jgi:hypothetical protein